VEENPGPRTEFETQVADRFGILPNFFRSASAAPELLPHLWGFARACYLDNPMPSLFKERLFVWLSRFCPVRYCIVRHVGFLLGGDLGHSSGDRTSPPQSIVEIAALLRRPSPWRRDMEPVYTLLEGQREPIAWPESGSVLEDAVFAAAAAIFVEPARSDRARVAVTQALGRRNFEYLSGFLAFVRTAHYWTMLHPEIETEADMRALLRGHQDLATLLLEDPEAGRCEMGGRLYEELTALRELHERRELERAKQELEERDRQKDQFIAVLAHELRNPLGAIRAAADAMGLLCLEDDRAVQLMQRLNRQTIAMARMLDDLLDASRIAFGKVGIRAERLSLSDLLAETLEDYLPRAQAAEVRIEADPPGESFWVDADRVRLRQVLDNLLSNAVKFTPASGSVRVSCARDGSRVVLAVRDSGVGFEATFADKLFEPFMQDEQGRDRADGGLGLGLAIASRLARLQGGTLTAASDGIGKGALFTLMMPLADLPAHDRPEPVAKTSPGCAGRKVLLVEDNSDVAESLADFLRLSGYSVSVTRDGRMAIDAALEAAPDIILCDLGLPGEMDGLAVARACRSQESLRSVRLIAMSGYSSPQDHANAKEAGFEGLLTKPLTRDALATMNAVQPR